MIDNSNDNIVENVNHYQIHWFPGHMMKTLRTMQADIKNVDAVLQLLDARIPASSINPEIAEIIEGKPTLYALNKADLADEKITAAWMKKFKSEGHGCVSISSKNRSAVSTVRAAIDKELEELLDRREKKGISGAKIRIMIVGIPNVGKSTFINTFAGTQKAKAADRPGVTRGKQWVTIGKYDLLDMPGVLWRKFERNEIAANLAFIGSIKDDVLDIETLATGLLGQIQKMYPERLIERYKLSEDDMHLEAYDLLAQIGRKRGMLMSGGVVNTERAAIMFVDEFRASKLGRVSLEEPSNV